MLVLAAPVAPAERPAMIDVRASRLGEAVRVLGRQSGASIGFRDQRFAAVKVRAVRGRFTAAEALERMLAGTGVRARLVAPGTFLIEAVPAGKRAAPPPAPAPARRQVAPDTQGTDDIVVTGSKRDIPLASYPGGVQIVDGHRISAAEGARGSGLIEASVASVASTHMGPGRNKLFVRGIADSSFVGPTQATVGQYWGNSRITYSAPDPSLRLYDVGRIEVLEGPQGTLYGAGSLGGVVRVVPNAPDLTTIAGQGWAGVQAIQHGAMGVDGGAVLNVPIVEDRLALRTLVFGAVDGGYIDDSGRGLEDVNRVSTLGGRAALRFAPVEGWTFDASVVGQRIEGDDSQYADRGADGLTRASSIAQPYRNEYWLADLVATRAWGAFELTSSIGYAHQYVYERFEGPALFDVARPEQAPAVDAVETAFTQANRIDMVTAETRLARHGAGGTGWMLGVSLLANDSRVDRRMGVERGRVALTGVENSVREATLYGEATLAPAPRFTVTLGGRLTHSELSGDSRDVLRAFAFRVEPEAQARRAETRLLPSVAAAYRLDDALTLFARYQQGFRPGGISVRREFIQRFEGDRVATIEAGARYRSARFDLSVNGAWTDWRSIQADLVDGFGFPATDNIGDGRVLSVGFASKWRPIEGLEFDAALYLNDSKVTNVSRVFSTITSEPVATDRLPNVADATGRVGFAYAAPLAGDESATLSGFARYVGQSVLGIGPVLGQLQGEYVDTGLELRIGTPRRGLSLSLTNLLDTRGNRFALGSPFLIRDRDQITPLQPRSLRLGFDLAF